MSFIRARSKSREIRSGHVIYSVCVSTFSTSYKMLCLESAVRGGGGVGL